MKRHQYLHLLGTSMFCVFALLAMGNSESKDGEEASSKLIAGTTATSMQPKVTEHAAIRVEPPPERLKTAEINAKSHPLRKFGHEERVMLAMGTPRLGFTGASTLGAVLSIMNNGAAAAQTVKVQSIRLNSAWPLSPASFPLTLDNVVQGRPTILQTAFEGSHFSAHRGYLLEVKGKYLAGGKWRPFTMVQTVSVPPSAPGSATVQSAVVEPNATSGQPFPHADVVIPSEVNSPPPVVPIGSQTGNMTPAGPQTSIQFLSTTSGGSGAGTAAALPRASQRTPGVMRAAASMPFQGSNDLVFVQNTSFGGPGGQPNDPSGASGGTAFNGPQTVFATGNTYAAFSSNGGNTFTQLDPTKIFPNNFDGGLCCDQVVHYSSGVNRFFWLMQFRAGANGQNRLRLASASPEALIASGGTAWTYWDLTSALFNLGNNMMDYPDLAVGNNFLYVSVDATNVDGLLVMRIPLTELRDSLTIHISYTNPADSTTAYGFHLVQNAGDEIFWPGHPNNNQLRIFSWQENSNSYFWRDVNLNPYPVGNYASLGPNGSDWLASLFSGGPGGTRVFNLAGTDEIWFQWMAGRGGGFPQPHIQLARIRHSDFSLIEQTQIWNATIAFGYASITTSANGLIGLSLAFGGGGYYGSPAVGIVGDGIVYAPCVSGGNAFRYGDYTTIREAYPNGALFSAVGYCTTFQSGYDPHYVLFGRSADVSPQPITMGHPLD